MAREGEPHDSSSDSDAAESVTDDAEKQNGDTTDTSTEQRPMGPVPRRSMLAAMGATGGVALAGCGGSNEEGGPTRTPAAAAETSATPTAPAEVPSETILVPHYDDQERGYWDMLMFACLQGLANREEPRVYAYYEQKSMQRWYDRPNHDVDLDRRIFYEWYSEDAGYDWLDFRELEDPYQLFEELDPLPFEGYVILDEEVPRTANVAANYASTENLLPVREVFLEERGLPDIEVVHDLRGTHKGVRFTEMNRRETYEWAIEHQFPETNHGLAANLATPDDPHVDADAKLPVNYFYTSNRARDYTVANRGFFMSLASKPGDPTRALKTRVLEGLDRHAYMFGWHQGGYEGQHIHHLSENGVLALGASTYAANFSFHSRVEIPDAVENFRAQGQKLVGEDVGPIDDKIYVAFVISDGDSLNFLMRRAQGGQWQLDARGDIPVGWEMQALLADEGPAILDMFARTATENDHFVGGVSGVGYHYPAYMPEDVLRDTLELTSEYFERTGLAAATVMSPGSEVSDAKTRLYQDVVGDQLMGCMEGYVRREADTERLYGGQPENDDGTVTIDPADSLAWLPTAYPAEGDLTADLQRLAESRSRRPLFVPCHIVAHGGTVEGLKQRAEALDDDVFEIVSPHELYAMFAAARDGSVTVEPPESFRPEIRQVSAGERNDLSVTVQGFGSGPQTAEIGLHLESEVFPDPITSTTEVTVPPNRRRTVETSIDVPAVDGAGEGTMDLQVDGESRVTVGLWFGEFEADRIFEAESGNHPIGTAVEDPDAQNGRAWQATPEMNTNVHMLWYPTRFPDEPGNYAAQFRIKTGNVGSNGKIAQIEVVENIPGSVEGGPTTPQGPTKVIRGTDFDASETYQYFTIPFEVPITDAPLEKTQRQYRVRYLGTQAVTVDHVGVARRPE